MGAKRIHGSLYNRMMENSKQPDPKVGMGITITHYTDRSCGTITRISKSGKTFYFKPDIATRSDKNGMSEEQQYTYKVKEDAKEQKAYKSKEGIWRVSKNMNGIALGFRNAYHDYSF